MDKSKVACRRFVVAGCQPSGIFKFVEATLNLISQGVDIAIDRNLYFPVFARRDHGIATPAFHIFANEIRIIASICQQHFWLWSICCNHEVIAFVIGNFPATDFSGYGKSDGICPEMNFGRKACLERPKPWI